MREFRSDINGLRCLAVVAVLLYHVDAPGFPGGYVGVDVFLVISGYLMTQIIQSGLQDGTFSLHEFWLSRARRILPALYVLLIVILAFGWFWLPASYQPLLARYAVASALFVSNILFDGEAGNYFAEPSRDNWLLHTWSLSVEAQFYLIYPLLLVAAAKASGRWSRAVPAVVCLWFAASLSLCLYHSETNQTYAFYSLTTRAWEFLAGALVYLLPPRFAPEGNARRMAEWAGLTMILVSILLFREDTRWPGLLATVPVAGTVLVLAADNRRTFWSGNPLVECIGKWSYSIYLWHWPIIVGLGLFGYPLTAANVVLVLLASILTGGLSYRWIENPVRRRKWKALPGAAMALGAAFCLVGFGLLIMHGKVSPARESAPEAAMDAHGGPLSIGNCGRGPVPGLLDCVHGNRRFITAAVWGDSHAQAVIQGIARAAQLHGLGVLYYSLSGCPPVTGAHVTGPERERNRDCESFNENVLRRLQLRKDIAAIIVARYSLYATDSGVRIGDVSAPSSREHSRLFLTRLTESLCDIAADRRVFVLKPVPEMDVNVSRYVHVSRQLGRGAGEKFIRYDEYARENAAVLSALDAANARCDVELLDPVPYLCRDGRCYGVVDGLALYRDDNHLNTAGNRLLVPMFDEVFR
jgi:peptidoglycan/LPS O-acetylase OafA/YrhL